MGCETNTKLHITSGDKSKKDMTYEVNGVIPKDKNSSVVGKTSTSINQIIQKSKKTSEQFGQPR